MALPDIAAAKDKGHSAAGCPPGLAKKSPACVPPGLAKKMDDHVRHDDRDDDHDRFRYSDRYDEVYSYRIGDRLRGDYALIPSPDLYGLDRHGTYYRVGDGVYQVDKDTMEVMAVIGLASRLLN
ncbi:MAG: excinuclease ABC subunit A [Pseudooceanicola sp.]|nr:excinuclease ABC subunit A [Pseudooceanicola sp.]